MVPRCCTRLSSKHLLHVLRNGPRNLEHAAARDANRLQGRVSRDHAALVELGLLDVRPDALHRLAARALALADDLRERGGVRDGLEEALAGLLLRGGDLLARSDRRLALVLALGALAA